MGEGELKLQQRWGGGGGAGRPAGAESTSHFVSPLLPEAGLHPEIQPSPHLGPFPQGLQA